MLGRMAILATVACGVWILVGIALGYVPLYAAVVGMVVGCGVSTVLLYLRAR